MKQHISDVGLPKQPLGLYAEEELTEKIGARIERTISAATLTWDNLTSLNNAIVNTFRDYGLEVEFAGVYAPRKENTLTTGPVAPTYGEGCPIIPLSKGAIAFSVRNHDSYLVPSTNTLEDEDPAGHWDCREAGKESKPDLTELIIAQKKIVAPRNGSPFLVVSAVYDIDIKGPNQISFRGALGLEKVIAPALDIIFPGDVDFELIPWVHYLPEDRQICPTS